MDLKVCTKCSSSLPLASFSIRNRTKGWLQPWCKECTNAHHRTNWVTSPTRRESVAAKSAAGKSRNRAFLDQYLQAHPCVDCGEVDTVVLDFDHLGDKSWNVSDMVRHGHCLDKIRAEIAKCEIRCANCHRRVTHRRRLGIA